MTEADEKAKAVELAYTKMLTTKHGTFKTVKTLACIRCPDEGSIDTDFTMSGYISR